jgi:hypothetical protein
MRTFIPNPNFINELAKETPQVRELTDAAKKSAVEANKIRHHIMPQQADPAVEVEVEGFRVFMVNTDYGGHLDEWGSINNPPYAPLRNGARNAGYPLEET